MNDDFILFVGASSKRKNLINVLKAFNKIENNNIKLKIVGLGKVYKIKDALFKNEKIEILNNIDDDILYSLYKKAKMLVFPSFYEGFGIPPLEAMNLSCPVIASDIPVFREIYQNSVLYVDPNNINEIKSSILELLNNDNLRSRLINLGLIQCKKYSWIKSAKKLLDNIN